MATADAALAIAESIINGDITQTTYSSEVVILRRATDYLPLKNGPVTSITSVTVGDSASALTAGDDDGYSAERFGIRRTYPYEWPAGKVTVTYVTGWAGGSEPTEIAEALTALETWVDSKPEIRASSIKIGDESVTLQNGSETFQPPDNVRTLLRKWVKRDA